MWESVVPKRIAWCSRCGKKFTPKNNNREICDKCRGCKNGNR